MNAFGAKQPYEAYYVDFDFTKVIVSPDTIASATVTAVDQDGVDVTNTVITTIKQNIASPKVYVWVTGGTSGKTYIITCKIITANGEKYEKDGELPVKELDYQSR